MDFDEYKNEIEYTKTPKKPYLKREHSADDAEQYAMDLRVYNDEMLKYREEKIKYSSEDNRLIEKFKQDAFKELGITKHPKREKLWSVAWERGHSCGLYEVWYHLNSLCELIM